MYRAFSRSIRKSYTEVDFRCPVLQFDSADLSVQQRDFIFRLLLPVQEPEPSCFPRTKSEKVALFLTICRILLSCVIAEFCFGYYVLNADLGMSSYRFLHYFLISYSARSLYNGGSGDDLRNAVTIRRIFHKLSQYFISCDRNLSPRVSRSRLPLWSLALIALASSLSKA